MKQTVKKLLALLMVAVLAVSLAACDSTDSGNPSTDGDTAGDTAQEGGGDDGAAPEASGDKMKVILCIGRRNDLSFQQSAYEGLLRIGEELGNYYEVEVREMGDDTTVWESALYEAADSGADFIVATGFQNKDNFETIPLEYPDIKFILFDQDVDYSSGELDNVLTVLFDSNESGFLAGAVAAYYTTSDNAANPEKVIGFVGGVDAVTINNFLVGYVEGARYVDPDITIMRAYVGDFMDTAKAKDLTAAQISQDADIIFQVAGGAGNGIIEAAAEREGVMAIGVDADQYETLAGTDLQEAIITSSLKRLDNAFFKILSDYAQDPASVPFGTTVTYGLGEDSVGIVFNDNLTASIGADNVAAVEEILEKIRSGEIVVSSAGDMTAEEITELVGN